MKSEKGPHIFWWLGSDRGWDWCPKVLISAVKNRKLRPKCLHFVLKVAVSYGFHLSNFLLC